MADCIRFPDGGGPSDYQLEILEELPKKKRVSVRGPHGLGKTTLAAWVVNWAILTSDDVKVPTTASAWRQLTKFLWPEIHIWSDRIKWNKVGREPFNKIYELLTLSLKRSPSCEAFAVASKASSAEFIEGAHAQRIVYVYDEAKAIPDEIWDASEGAFAGAGEDTEAEAFALAISTPGEQQGRFYEIFRNRMQFNDWWARHVTLEEAIKAGRISREWAEKRRIQWGEKSAVYRMRCLGEFAESEADSLILLSWVEAANLRWLESFEDH